MNIHAMNSGKPSIGASIAKSLWNSLVSMFVGAVALLGFVFSPVWNYPDRMKVVTRCLLICFSGLVFLWMMFWLGQRPVFTIKHIQVESIDGAPLKHVNLPAIRSLVVSNLAGNFFSIRLDSARTAFESVPWVRTASVRRVWPNGLAVTIQEHDPIGIWGGNEEPMLINKHGEIFVANMAEAEADRDLLKFSGPLGSNREVISLYNKMNEWFKPWNAKAVEVTLSNRYAWSAKLDNGIRFEFGRDLDPRDREQIEARVDRFFKIWPQLQEKMNNKVELVDLRYPNGFALRVGGKYSSDRKDLLEEGVAQIPPVEKIAKNETPSIKKAVTKDSVKKEDKKKVKWVEKGGRNN